MAERKRIVRVILNGKRADDRSVQRAFDRFDSATHRLETEVTTGRGHAVQLTRDAVGDGVDTVVAAGGDGTLHEVVEGLLDADAGEPCPSVAVLPLGTANDFARACEIPEEPAAALGLAVSAVPVPVDVGMMNGRCFINMASGGFGSQVTAETPDEIKEFLGSLSYLLTGVRRFNEFTVENGHVRGPDFEWAGRFYVLAVGNGRKAGGGITVCPEALLDDGRLDVVILPEIPAEQRLESLKELLTQGLSFVEREVVYRQLPWLEVSAPAGLSLNLDGEPLEGDSFRFELLPKRIHMHLPSHAPLA